MLNDETWRSLKCRPLLLGLPAPAIGDAADKFMAIAANQTARRAALRSSYDYIVVGSGASGSVVARRLAENQDEQVLLLDSASSHRIDRYHHIASTDVHIR